MNGQHSVRSIVIVGGGSAGWMAAAYLRKVLPADVLITQVESPHVATIGVGEGTIPVVRDFIGALQLDEREWMTACQATFKLGVRFDNWFVGDDWWWHPFFFRHPSCEEKRLVDAWLFHRQQGAERFETAASLYDYCMSWQLAKENRCPRFRASFGDFENWNSDHAFHLDAALFGQYLRDRVALPAGVEHVVAHVSHVECAETGQISCLHLEDGRQIAGDLFIDCTGFRRLLMQSIGPASYTSFANELLCDRAMAFPVPYEDPWSEMRPYTLSTAMSAGWIWQIGLFHRVGMGYVYSSQFIEDDRAEEELRAFAGEHRVRDLNVNRIRFQAGCLNAPWINNCVAVGLAEGFVEPLEATSLGVTQHHLKKLAAILERESYSADQIDSYNRDVRAIYDEIRRFLVSHYCFTHRTDTPFWRAVAELDSPLKTLRAQSAATIPADVVGTRVFSTQSWVCLGAGLDGLPSGRAAQHSGVLSIDEMVRARDSQRRVLDGFMRQYDFLRHLRGE